MEIAIKFGAIGYNGRFQTSEKKTSQSTSLIQIIIN